jgi:hypothetical protein
MCLPGLNHARRRAIDLFFEFAAFSRHCVYMDPDKFSLGDDLIRMAFCHHMTETYTLAFYFQDAGSYSDDISGDDLRFVFRFLFNGNHSAIGAAQIFRRHAYCGKKLPRGFIEFFRIKLHVHVAHMVALPRIYDPPVCFNHIGPKPDAITIT